MQNLNSEQSLFERIQEWLRSKAELLSHVPRAIFNTNVKLTIIRGKVQGTDEWVSMLYVGRGRNRAYIQGRILRDAKVISSITKTIFSYRPELARLTVDADVVFIDIGLPYQAQLNKNGEYIVLPDWISMIIPIGADWESVESRFNKTTRRMIRRIPYRSELTRDPMVIAQFYDEFYLPYLKLRHEDAVVETRSAVERRARQGGILRVIGDDGPIVAGVVYPEDGILYYLWLGMAERYLDDQPEGALAASYYFCLRYAHKHSFRAANWLGTRSFPTDGVYQFKRKWGPLVEDSFSPDSILFKPAQNNWKAVSFAEKFPLLVRRDGRLEQIYCTTAETVGDVEINRMISAYACDGIDQITIIHVQQTLSQDSVTPSETYPNVRIVTTDIAGFARYYQQTFPASS